MPDASRRETFDVPDKKIESKDNADKIKEEIEKLSSKELTPSLIIELYNKYGDDETIIDEILRLRAKKHNKIKKQAREVASKIHRKYAEGSRPLHEILDRMLRYKKDNNWSTREYDEFRKELSYLLTGKRALEIDYNQNISANRSRINRTLGNPQLALEARLMGDGLKIKDTEHGILNEFLKLHEMNMYLNRTVFMHSLMYEDCSLVAMTGEYKRERHIASNYIHPVLACMFLPKFDIFEIHMLYSNFGSIIKARYEKKPILTEPDALLFDDITSDPNDVVCEIDSPITDLLNRYKVQISLWELVLKLRNGNYYEGESISSFMRTLNACRNNLYDNADLAYNQDEGAMMRRLLSVFSLRPTIIYTRPIYSVASFNAGPGGVDMGLMMAMGMGGNLGMQPLGNVFPFNNQPVYTVTSIPMINMQIPPYTIGTSAEPKDLRTSTSQLLWINENKTIVPKEQAVLYSKEILIFYVNRRIQRIQIKTFSSPLAFSQLPLTMSSFERLNTYPVNISPSLTLDRSGEVYQLRSVVAVTETEITQGEKTTNLITGCTGLLMSHRNISGLMFDSKYYLYDPFGASLPVRSPEEDGYFMNKPISYIPVSSIAPTFSPPQPGGTVNASFTDMASYAGTIFIYSKPSGYNPSEIITI